MLTGAESLVIAFQRCHEGKRREGEAAEPAFLDAVLVEAEDQNIEIMATSALLALWLLGLHHRMHEHC